MKKKHLLVSFSGGETSAYMTYRILNAGNYRRQFDRIVVIFANTGEEREETLEFIDECDRRFGFNTVWIEAVQYPNERRATGFRVVNFKTASRHGEPFEAAIKKYGIPNQSFKDCTRNLKRVPIEAYAESLGWGREDYVHAIGIRLDEVDRQSSNSAARKCICYPLIKTFPTVKAQINKWWSQQPFRLRLKSWEGNCKWCWKKSLRKHFTIISTNPKAYDFPRRMENLYATLGPEFAKAPPPPPDYRRTFFRGALSTNQLFSKFEQAKRNGLFVPAEDAAVSFVVDWDVGGGCEESCEIFADEDENTHSGLNRVSRKPRASFGTD